MPDKKMSTKELEQKSLDLLGVKMEDLAQELIDKLSAWMHEDTSFIIDSVDEAGRELLPPGVTDQLWSGFVLGYYAGMNDAVEDDEDEEDAADHDPDKMITCCFCGTEMLWKNSNNPWPIIDDDTSRCCNMCNANKVIPARLHHMTKAED